jgi:LysR family transcriptional regulator for bpeEF and oprC
VRPWFVVEMAVSLHKAILYPWPMNRLEATKLFLEVVEAGSFSKAARLTGTVQSTVSKQIAALEARLGAQLVRRSSRGLTLTAAGQHYYDEALRLVEEFDALDEAVSERERAPSGLVRLTCPPGLAPTYLLPNLGPFLARYPQLSIEFIVSQRVVNLIEERIDVAIRVGDLDDSDLGRRQIGTAAAIVVASTAYLEEHGEPATPADLDRHPCIASMHNGRPRAWQFARGSERASIDPKGSIRSDDVEVTRAAVKSGLGIGHAASWLFRDEIASGSIRRILAGYRCAERPINAVWAGNRALPRRIAVVVDHLASVCATEPDLRIR